MKKYLTKVDFDENDDLLITFPDELLIEMGWGEGTELDITYKETNCLLVKKHEDSQSST